MPKLGFFFHLLQTFYTSPLRANGRFSDGTRCLSFSWIDSLCHVYSDQFNTSVRFSSRQMESGVIILFSSVGWTTWFGDKFSKLNTKCVFPKKMSLCDWDYSFKKKKKTGTHQPFHDGGFSAPVSCYTVKHEHQSRKCQVLTGALEKSWNDWTEWPVAFRFLQQTRRKNR